MLVLRVFRFCNLELKPWAYLLLKFVFPPILSNASMYQNDSTQTLYSPNKAAKNFDSSGCVCTSFIEIMHINHEIYI